MKIFLVITIVLMSILLGYLCILKVRWRIDYEEELLKELNAAVDRVKINGDTLLRALSKSSLDRLNEMSGLMNEKPYLSAKDAFYKTKMIDETDERANFAAGELLETLAHASEQSEITKGQEIFNNRMCEIINESKEIRMKKAMTSKRLFIFAGLMLGIILL